MREAVQEHTTIKFARVINEKIIQLEPEAFDAFAANLLANQVLILDNLHLMYEAADRTLHCPLVRGVDRTDAILFESEGYGYARHAAVRK